MSELVAVNHGDLTVLDGLALEARMYSEAMAMNMLQLGRVLTEAKKLVKHGEWTEWIHTNAHMGETTAQNMMRAYRRFGSIQAIEGIEKSKVIKMLSLPSGTEEEFLEENDVNAMSAREVEQAVKKVRQEAEAQLAAERNARLAAEERVQELMDRPPELPEEVKARLKTQADTIESQNSEISRLAGIGRSTLEETNRLRRENASLQREVAERDDMLAETQQEYDRLQSDLLNMQSMAAKGDAERAPADSLTLDVFAGAVRQFMGVCARMPQMHSRFGTMILAEKDDWDELLRVIEKWAKDSRSAMNTIAYGEVEIRG
ncbi:MAG: DUF3102 domain-containing protein [Clostridia bacterium]|nr:DUF3102 domain-containing protein [Clostridia bacterium]